jgi:lipopolysaccharide biosynthesis regulator YciM
MKIFNLKHKLYILLIITLLGTLPNGNHIFPNDTNLKNDKNDLFNSYSEYHRRVNYAFSIHNKSENDEALKIILNVLKHYPNSYRGNELAGRIYDLRGNVNKTFLHWLRTLKTDHINNYLYINKIYKLIIDTPKRQKTIKAFLNLLRKTRYQPIKTLLNYKLGHLYRANGEISKSKIHFKKIGFITNWSIIGPFDNDRSSGFNYTYIPEKMSAFK